MNSTELQEKINALKEKMDSLKSKPWFRAIQVVYILSAVLSGGFVILLGSAGDSNSQPSIFIWGTVVVIASFWTIKKVGYYIILGNVNTIKPEYKHTLEAKLKNNERK